MCPGSESAHQTRTRGDRVDRAKALELFETLSQSGVGGWQLLEFVDNGKSAAVFKATKDDQVAAIKVFDTELIAKFGDAALLERMDREGWLAGHDHPNIVKIFDSGIEPTTGHHYLVMEFLSGPSLAADIGNLDSEHIPNLVEQLASAAEFLETKGLAHRDIKPANIVVIDGGTQAVLLDFGVLKPVGEGGLTDQPGGNALFVGTNQYASPEFALREEEDSATGWRAVTFYQLGAVIHDMLTGRSLFGEHTGVPARLAHAVQKQVPEIDAPNAPPYLQALAQNCLVKSPEARLKLVSWDSFKQPASRPNRTLELQERIRQRFAAAQTREVERQNYEADDADDEIRLMHAATEVVLETLTNLSREDPPFPRRIVYRNPASPVDSLRADFEPSSSFDLPDGLTLLVNVDVIDPTSQIVHIRASATPKVAVSTWCPRDGDTVYVGPLVSSDIEDGIFLFLLSTIDAAQMGNQRDNGRA